MALIEDPNPGPGMRTWQEALDKLRQLRIRINRDRSDSFVRKNLIEQHKILQWAMGATDEEIVNQTFLGGVLNVDL